MPPSFRPQSVAGAKQILAADEYLRPPMKPLFKRMLVGVVLLVVLAGAFKFLASGHLKTPSRSFEEMENEAVLAVRRVGGTTVLEEEAKAVLRAFRSTPNHSWEGVSKQGRACPAIVDLNAALSPDGIFPWVEPARGGLPDHVVIRWGSHARYAYIWIFDDLQSSLGQVHTVRHLEGTLYLSERNE